MPYHFEFRPYRRRFQQPLKTRYGSWAVREGILLRLTADRVSYGEIAPLPWFGTETLQQALDYCHQQPDTLTTEAIAAISPKLPACQFGFESAVAFSAQNLTAEFASETCALLPTGTAALAAWQPLWQAGHRTFKWKIGAAAMTQDLDNLEKLRRALPHEAKLRIDANGGCTLEQAKTWLQVCDRLGIEFLEQPLPPHQFEQMQQLSDRYETPIALDESVATLKDLKTYAQAWSGLFVVKAAIAGFPSQLYQFCQPYRDRLIFSSVFETPVARQAILTLIHRLYGTATVPYALGLGTQQWFNDSLETNFEQLWQSL
ncbi:MAG: o-succinylbenzoate synthase [Leptolyngbyaceae cyanobacterium SL_1_1]|nr:o-succinylbenzoate synthase [Leptolyngbyaceae cyanobacterium RM1_1_2]NJO10599.1 o-succinylbenzoate synthase [Leptolyngbyaceae cyanobacterium SL_1_1]